jgi:hypothetical protein
MTIRPVGAKLFHTDGRTDTQADNHDEANSHCFEFSVLSFENVPEMIRGMLRGLEGL